MRGSSQMKLTRRQRIRTLVKLTQLTEVYTTNELRDPHTAAHAELHRLIGGLSRRRYDGQNIDLDRAVDRAIWCRNCIAATSIRGQPQMLPWSQQGNRDP
jgi:hypothetical protein